MKTTIEPGVGGVSEMLGGKHSARAARPVVEDSEVVCRGLAISGVCVRGIDLDGRTGCAHYRSELDIIAIKFKCCLTYYSCFYCHQLGAGHPAQIWLQAEFEEKAVLCGACGAELTIRQYLNCEAVCPLCRARFNARCALHHHLYSETSTATS